MKLPLSPTFIVTRVKRDNKRTTHWFPNSDATKRKPVLSTHMAAATGTVSKYLSRISVTWNGKRKILVCRQMKPQHGKQCSIIGQCNKTKWQKQILSFTSNQESANCSPQASHAAHILPMAASVPSGRAKQWKWTTRPTKAENVHCLALNRKTKTQNLPTLELNQYLTNCPVLSAPPSDESDRSHILPVSRQHRELSLFIH